MNILVGGPKYPYPPTSGDKLRWAALLRELGGEDRLTAVFGLMPGRERRSESLDGGLASVDVVRTGFLAGVARAVLMEVRGRPSVFGRLATPTWQRRVLAAASEADVVLLLGPSAGMVPPLPVPALLDLQDVRSRMRTPRGERVTRQAILASELRLARRFAIALAADSDREWLVRNGADPGRVFVVPNGADRRLLEITPDPRSSTILFVGNLAYAPNLEGIRWFLQHCWPGLQSHPSGPRLRVVGYNAQRLSTGTTPALEVVVDAPDLFPYYADAGLVIAPLRSAIGVQNKVLEGMAAGLPVVCTSAVAAGLHPDHPALVCDRPDAFVEACRRLLADAGARHALGRKGQDYVRRHHDWGISGSLLRKALHAIA